MLEALGGARERVRSDDRRSFDLGDIAELEHRRASRSRRRRTRGSCLSPGLADELFEHDGQITKREIRAVTLSALAPRQGELLWDIGAGSGSIAIEWMLGHPSIRAIAIERAPTAPPASAATRPPSACRSSTSSKARARALAGLAPPDAVFIGGGASEPGVLDAASRRFAPAGGWSSTP